MIERELPTINNQSLSCCNYSGTSIADWTYRPNVAVAHPYQPSDYQNVQVEEQFKKRDRHAANLIRTELLGQTIQPAPVKEKKMDKISARIVRVFIVDTDENVPLEKRVLIKDEEKLTDLTDQELFFEVDLKSALDAHNAYRQTVLDKKQTNKLGKEIYLEPIKIRDLSMTVVNVASF